MRTLMLAPILLLAGCSQSTTRSTAATVPAGNPEPVAAPAEAPPAPPSPADSVAVTEAAERVAVRRGGPLLRAGTPLFVRLDQTVDTRRSRTGDPVHATLSRPVVVNGRTVLPAGTRFNGHVTTSDPSGRLKGRAYIGVALDSFQYEGRRHRISTHGVVRASAAHKKRNGILIGGAAGVGAAIGAIAGGAKGALIGAGAGAGAGTAGAAVTGKLHAAIPAETPLRFTLRSAVEL
jgi:hypothetical protein